LFDDLLQHDDFRIYVSLPDGIWDS
jgi:hypothetical protein